jgi:hypothetical protein
LKTYPAREYKHLKHTRAAEAVMRMQSHAQHPALTVPEMVSFLELTVLDTQAIWDEWIVETSSVLQPTRSPCVVTNESMDLSVSSSIVTPVAERKSAYAFKKCKLTLLRYMVSMLHLTKSGEDCAAWTEEITAQSLGENGVTHIVLGMQVAKPWKNWFSSTFMPQVHSIQNKYRHLDGNVINIISTGLRSSSAFLFSVLVSGIGGTGEDRTSMWAMGRLEWLALELMFDAKHLLDSTPDDPEIRGLWDILERTIGCNRPNIEVDIIWTPHKLEFNGEDMESTAAGANDRADILLVARQRETIRFSIIAVVYHTTNVSENTASMRSGQAYPETRLLWRDRMDTGNLPNLAMRRLVMKHGIIPQDIPLLGFGAVPDPSEDGGSDSERESEPTVVGDRDLDL